MGTKVKRILIKVSIGIMTTLLFLISTPTVEAATFVGDGVTVRLNYMISNQSMNYQVMLHNGRNANFIGVIEYFSGTKVVGKSYVSGDSRTVSVPNLNVKAGTNIKAKISSAGATFSDITVVLGLPATVHFVYRMGPGGQLPLPSSVSEYLDLKTENNYSETAAIL